MRKVILTINVPASKISAIKDCMILNLPKIDIDEIEYRIENKYERFLTKCSDFTDQVIVFENAFQSSVEYNLLKELFDRNNIEILKIYYQFKKTSEIDFIKNRTNMSDYTAEEELNLTLLYLLEMNNLFRKIIDDHIEISFI